MWPSDLWQAQKCWWPSPLRHCNVPVRRVGWSFNSVWQPGTAGAQAPTTVESQSAKSCGDVGGLRCTSANGSRTKAIGRHPLGSERQRHQLKRNSSLLWIPGFTMRDARP